MPVDISVTAFCFLCVCTNADFSANVDFSTNADFSAKDKLAVSNFARRFIGVKFAPKKPKIGQIGQHAGPVCHTHPHVNITVECADVHITIEILRL